MSGGTLSVAFVSTYPPTHCGVAEYTRMLASSLEAVAGTRTVVLADTGRNPSEHAVPAFTPRKPETLRGVLDGLAMLGGADILHVQHEYGIFGDSPILVQILEEARRERLAKKIVVTLHTVYRPGWGPRGAPAFQGLIARTADAIIVHSILQEYELHAQLGTYKANINLIPHGSTPNPFTSWSRARLAKALNIENIDSIGTDHIIAVPGFIRPDKDLESLITIAEKLENTIILLGGERREGQLPQLENIIIIPRYLNTLEILMLSSLSDVILLPYRDPPGKYAVSGVLHLTLSSRRPVIGARTPRLVELYSLAPQLTYTPGDATGMLNILTKALSAPDLLRGPIEKLRRYAAETDWHVIASLHAELYKSLIFN